ncbi:squamosa promoter-binding protein-like (SBP domain) transcription factor family protein [Actinidia rufa]|uniref:Squamosa promoter-binding protein-like (SBP domain) transcription factor family protein n=1 Tax=Actinidia rufa TaxID=165716 RepID=A0A7J0DHS7_9ERIC|nr:squamosa promoter-binding protein-like (SBP domain) transcription factor family protein [Actinidia rufa]
MDWELKKSDWDLTELGQEDLVESSSLGVLKNGGGLSVELKLGGLGDLGHGSVGTLKETSGSTISSPSSGPSKRSKSISRPQNVSCFVDGCTNDLTDCRDYYRRHRVCERHSKTQVVVVGGKEKRFCQQCSRPMDTVVSCIPWHRGVMCLKHRDAGASRFQSLGEFDEAKRSCRKRLDGHNRCRRKPQPEAFYMSSGTYLSNHQGTRLLCFSGPQPHPTSTAGAVPTKPGVATHHQDLHATDQPSILPYSFACIYNGGDKQFPFSLANDPERSIQTVPEVSISQRLVNNSASPETGWGRKQILPNGSTESVHSKRALSLLSSHTTQTSETSSSHLLQQDVNHHNQPIGTGLHYDGLSQYSRSQGLKEKPSALVPQASNANHLCDQIFQVVHDDLLENEAFEVLPFSWK